MLYCVLLTCVESVPVCEAIQPRSLVAENERVHFTCSMAYRWRSVNAQFNVFSDVQVSFGWDSSTTSTKALPRSQSTGSEEGNLTVEAEKPVIPAQNCTIRFTFTPPYSSPLYTFADNSVSFTCRTDPIPVLRKFSQYVLHKL